MTNNKKGWILYNGNLKHDKILRLVKRIELEAKKQGLDIELVKNNDIIVIHEFDKSSILHVDGLELPEYVIFWDKDVILASIFEKNNIRTFNSSESIKNCDNKAFTYNILQKNNILMPTTITAPFVFYNQSLDDKYLNSIIDKLGLPLIIKEYYGSYGMQVYKVDTIEEMKNTIDKMGNKGFMFQKFIKESSGKDIRVVIVGDKVIGSIKRINEDDFRANITIGGSGILYELNDAEKNLSLNAHKCLNLDFSGVDLLIGKDGPILCEVNSNVNFLSFESATNMDIAGEIIKYIKKELSL